MNRNFLLLLGALLSATASAQAWYGGPPAPWYGPYQAPATPAYRPSYQRPNLRIQTQPSAEGYLVTINLQGLEPPDVSVTRSGRWLLVRKSSNEEQSEQTPGSWSYSRSFGSFSRQVTLPRDADLDAMTRQDGEGVILLKVPRIAR